MRTIRIEGYEFELHDDGVVAISGDEMSAGAIVPLRILREFYRRTRTIRIRRKS